METKLGIVVGLISVMLSPTDFANAQAPSSIAGVGILASISDGIYPYASHGYAIQLFANSGNTYQTIAIYNVTGSSGTYTYLVTSPTTAIVTGNDIVIGSTTTSVIFDSSSSGSAYATAKSYPGAFQTANFNFAIGNAPSSIAGKTIVAGVVDGRFPFSSAGSFTMLPAVSGSSYTILGDGVFTRNSSGTYSYSLPNRSTGKLQLNDALAGASTVYIGLIDPSHGGYAIKHATTAGFQVGTFVIQDTTPPLVKITTPTTGKTYTNSQTVAITATASDDIGVTSVEFYDGTMLKWICAPPTYVFNWPITPSDNGTHVWTARAYDAAGNVSASAAVTLFVSLDSTPPTVAISSPANGASLAAATVTVSGSASDTGAGASGVSLVEVRVNGGAWQPATGTTSWSRSVTLTPCGNIIEARGRDKAGYYSTTASVSVTYTPPNTVPSTPTNISPASAAANVSVTPILQASPFKDADCIGDTHAASQWQVLKGAGVTVIADSGTDTVNKVTWTVPSAKLYYGSNYQWRVRYRDSRNGWSSYSVQTTFKTGGPLLSESKQGANIVFKWPTNALGFSLQWVTNVGADNWSNATPAPVAVSGKFTVTNGISNRATFYRLKQ